jgi:AI-2 transport protein TqsA
MNTNEYPSVYKSVVLISAAVILLTVMHFAADFLMPIMLAGFFAVLLTPIYRWLKMKRVPAGLALLFSIGVMIVVALFLALLIGNSLSVMAQSLAGYEGRFSQRLDELQGTVGSVSQIPAFKEALSSVEPGSLVNVLGFVLGAATAVFKRGLLILFVTMFVLAEAPQFKARIVRAYGADHYLTRNISELSGLLISYFGLRALVNLIVAVATGIMLWLFGIEHAALWAVMTFFLSFVPYIGAIIALLPPILLAYADGGLALTLAVIGFAVLINTLSENIVAPMVMGRGLSVSPTVVFISFLFWMFILGGSGALIAMPLTVTLILFMSSYEETRGLAAIMGSTPEKSVTTE